MIVQLQMRNIYECLARATTVLPSYYHRRNTRSARRADSPGWGLSYESYTRYDTRAYTSAILISRISNSRMIKPRSFCPAAPYRVYSTTVVVMLYEVVLVVHCSPGTTRSLQQQHHCFGWIGELERIRIPPSPGWILPRTLLAFARSPSPLTSLLLELL